MAEIAFYVVTSIVLFVFLMAMWSWCNGDLYPDPPSSEDNPQNRK